VLNTQLVGPDYSSHLRPEQAVAVYMVYIGRWARHFLYAYYWDLKVLLRGMMAEKTLIELLLPAKKKTII